MRKRIKWWKFKNQLKETTLLAITLASVFLGTMSLAKLLEEQFTVCLIFVACAVWLTAFFKANIESWCNR